jgi:hypothetical protein
VVDRAGPQGLGAGDLHAEVCAFAADKMAKALLGSSLTTGQPGEGVVVYYDQAHAKGAARATKSTNQERSRPMIDLVKWVTDRRAEGKKNLLIVMGRTDDEFATWRRLDPITGLDSEWSPLAPGFYVGKRDIRIRINVLIARDVLLCGSPRVPVDCALILDSVREEDACAISATYPVWREGGCPFSVRWNPTVEPFGAWEAAEPARPAKPSALEVQTVNVLATKPVRAGDVIAIGVAKVGTDKTGVLALDGSGAAFFSDLMREPASVVQPPQPHIVRAENRRIGEEFAKAPPPWAYTLAWRLAVMAVVEDYNCHENPRLFQQAWEEAYATEVLRTYHVARMNGQTEKVAMGEVRKVAGLIGSTLAIACHAYERGRPGPGGVRRHGP